MKSLPALLAPQLRQTLLKLSLLERAKEKAQRALQALTGFAKGLQLKYNDIEVGFDLSPELGLADNGDLEHDLLDLLIVSGEAAKSADTSLALFIDELQYVQLEVVQRSPCSGRACAPSTPSRRSRPCGNAGRDRPQRPCRARSPGPAPPAPASCLSKRSGAREVESPGRMVRKRPSANRRGRTASR